MEQAGENTSKDERTQSITKRGTKHAKTKRMKKKKETKAPVKKEFGDPKIKGGKAAGAKGDGRGGNRRKRMGDGQETAKVCGALARGKGQTGGGWVGVGTKVLLWTVRTWFGSRTKGGRSKTVGAACRTRVVARQVTIRIAGGEDSSLSWATRSGQSGQNGVDVVEKPQNKEWGVAGAKRGSLRNKSFTLDRNAGFHQKDPQTFTFRSTAQRKKTRPEDKGRQFPSGQSSGTN